MAVADPKTKDAARRLCERYSAVSGQIAAEEALRDAAIAEVNARADKALAPMLKKRDELSGVIEPWFLAKKDELLKGKRKTFELGGCVLGTRKGKDKLGVDGDAGDKAEALNKERWGKGFVTMILKPDANAIAKGLDGRHCKKLTAMGFSIVPGVDAFTIKATVQHGTEPKTS